MIFYNSFMFDANYKGMQVILIEAKTSILVRLNK